MKCFGCEKADVGEQLLAGHLRCRECGSDWSSFAGALLMPKILFNEGLSSAIIGDLTTAEQRLQASVQLDPACSTAWMVLGKVFAQQDRLVQAIGAWKKAAKLDASNESIQKSIAWARNKLNAAKSKPTPICDLVLAGEVTVTASQWSATGKKLLCKSTGEEMTIEGKPALVSLRDLVVEGKKLSLRVQGAEITADRLVE
ncbi:MAG TPA: hypothetical protein PLI09_23670 [Candidatus Hydrogenedentes bacterium]|nr:hypothetical protein [Candidatus Hydrogenedentota bacterium]